MAESLEDLLGAYWDIAYQEGRSGRPNGTQAQEVLSAIRAAVEQARREEREACLKAADEAYATEHVLCAIRARNEKGGA